MIVYDLECEFNHRFEGWFGSAEDYDKQLVSKLLSCPVCNTGNVVRRPSAAYISSGIHSESSERNREPVDKPVVQKNDSVTNVHPEVMNRLIEHIIKNTEDVGNRFSEEARKIHYQEAPERHIRGTATSKDVESLRDEGIEVVALPLAAQLNNKSH